MAVFMPIATKGEAFVSLGHLGGLTQVTWILPGVLLVFSILYLNNKIDGAREWFLGPAIGGLLLAGVNYYAGNGHLHAFARISRRFDDQLEGSVMVGMGTCTLVFSCLVICFIVMAIHRQSKGTPTLTGQE